MANWGNMNLAEGNAELAVTHLSKAIEVLNALNPNASMRLVELHRGLASAHRAQQNFSAAESSLNTTLAVLAKLGGDHDDLNETIRKELSEVLSQRNPAPDRTLDPAELLAEYFVLAKAGQSMYITQGESPVLADPADPDGSITTLAAGKEVWSLEFADPWHRVYLPKEERFGWVDRKHLRDYESFMIESGTEKLKQALQDQPPENLKACLNAFERARPEEGFSDPQQGIAVIEKSLATIQTHHKGTNSLVALLYEDLIDLYHQSGNDDQVLRIADKTLTTIPLQPRFQTSGHRNDSVATRRCLCRTGRPRRRSERVGGMFESLSVARFGPEDPRTQGLHLRLAANQLRLGNDEQAERTYKDLLATQSMRDDQPSLLRALALLGLGELAATARQPAQAIKYLSSAIDDFEKLKHPVPLLSAKTLYLLGYCYGETGEPGNGLDQVIEAEKIDLGPHGNALKLAILTGKSRLAKRAVSSDAAREAADEAIQFAETQFGKESLKKHDPLHAKGVAIGRADPTAAAASFTAARQAVAEYTDQALAFQNDQRKISFASEDRRRLDQALALALEPQNGIVAERSVEWLINGQRRLPEWLALDAQARARTTTQDELTLLKSYQRAAKARADVPLQTHAHPASSYFKEQIQRLDAERKATFDKLPEDIKVLYRNDASQNGSSWIECDRVRARLATGEVLILFRRIPDHGHLDDPAFDQTPEADRPNSYVAWIVPARDAGPIQSVILGHDVQVEGTIRQMISTIEFLTELKSDQIDYRVANQQESDRLSALGDQVWKSIEGKLPPATTHLTLCLEGPLHHVPWAALPTKDKKMLVDRYTIRHVSSARDLLATPVASELSTPRMLLDPSFENQDSELFELSKPDLAYLSNRARGTKFHLDKPKLRKAVGAVPDIIDDLLDLLDPLGDEFGDDFEEPEDQLEIDAFRATFGKEAKVHMGSRASEFRYFAAARPRCLHITAPMFTEPLRKVEQTAEFASFEAQGLIRRDKTAFHHPLMQCGILLAGCGLDEAEHPLSDGVLTGEQIVAQDLRGTELVTLGVAPKIPFSLPFGGLPESETLAMLPQAFQLAGARAVLSNDWKTNQPSAQRLLIAFYKQLASGKAKAAALRAAQLEIRDRSGAEPMPATFWANFRLTGEGWDAHQ
jgi:CHAT domain-containing protein